MAERDEQATLVVHADEPAVAAACDILEEHALDRIAGAELEHLLRRRFDDLSCHEEDCTKFSRGRWSALFE